MKVISMHKVDAAMEAGAVPSQDLIQGMGRLMGDLRRSGSLVDGAGLRPSATRVRLRVSGGQRTLEKGPYAGANELVAGVLKLQVREMDEAIRWASRAGEPVPEAARAAVAAVISEMTTAGVLQGVVRLQPSSKGLRIKVQNKRSTVLDGPFAESKELIAGFVIFDVPSLDAAQEWCVRFADVIGDVEMDVLLLEQA
jgi:hypothetical protein